MVVTPRIACCALLLEQVPDARPVLGIKADRRFVEHEHPRAMDEGSTDQHDTVTGFGLRTPAPQPEGPEPLRQSFPQCAAERPSKASYIVKTAAIDSMPVKR